MSYTNLEIPPNVWQFLEQAIWSGIRDGFRQVRLDEDHARRLTKREQIAAMALQGQMANPEFTTTSHAQDAEVAVRAADALLAELEKEGGAA